MGFLKLMFSKNMNIVKSSNHMTANFLFEPSSNGKRAELGPYISYAPMLLFRQIYRSFVPRSVGRKIEKAFNWARQRRFKS